MCCKYIYGKISDYFSGVRAMASNKAHVETNRPYTRKPIHVQEENLRFALGFKSIAGRQITTMTFWPIFLSFVH